MADNISVKLTADQVQLNQEFARARAAAAALNNELNQLARTANKSGMTAQLNSDLMRVSEASLTAKAKVGELEGQIKAASNTAGGMHGSVSALTREFRALFDELSAGRVRMVPGTIAQIANLGFGIQGGMLAAYGAIILVAGGLAYLSYETYEASEHAKALALNFALTGRGATESEDAIQGEINALREMPGVTNAIARGVVEWEAAHGEINDRINVLVNDLLPSLATAGERDTDKVVEATGKLKESLQTIATGDVPSAIEAFTQLSKTHQELRGKEALSIQTLIEHGQQLNAVKAIIALFASEAKQNYTGLQQDIKNTSAQLQQAKDDVQHLADTAAAYVSPEEIAGIQQAAVLADERVRQLEDRLNHLKATAASFAPNLISVGQVEEGLRKIEASTTMTRAKVAQVEVDALQGVLRSENLIGDARLSVEKLLSEKKVDLIRKTSTDIIAEERNAANREGLIGATRLQKDIETDRLLLKNAKLTADDKLNIQNDLEDKLSALHTKQFAVDRRADREGETAARAAAREKERIDNEVFSNRQRVDELNLGTTKAMLDKEVALHQITRDEEAGQLKQLAQDQAYAQIFSLSVLQNGLDQSSALWQKYEDEIEKILAKLREYKAQIDLGLVASTDKEIKQEVSLRRRGIAEMTSAENTFVSSIMSGNVTMYGALLQAGQQFIEKELEANLRGMTERLLLSKEELAADKSLGQMGVLWDWLFEGQKTGAAVAGSQARVAAQAAGTAESSAIAVAAGSTQIENDAMKAASGAYQAVVGIPVVGPILAPIAAGVAFGAVMAFDNLASFDVGTNYVPNDMIAKVHKGERIVTASDNADLSRSMNGGGVHLHYAPNINGVPMPNMKSILRDGGNDLLAYLGRMARNGTLQNYIGAR